MKSWRRKKSQLGDDKKNAPADSLGVLMLATVSSALGSAAGPRIRNSNSNRESASTSVAPPLVCTSSSFTHHAKSGRASSVVKSCCSFSWEWTAACSTRACWAHVREAGNTSEKAESARRRFRRESESAES